MDIFDTLRMREEERRRYRDASVLNAELEAMKKEQGPAGRLLPERTEQIREARERKPEPERAPRISEAPPQEAERMAYRPTGLQRAPSPGGSNYINTRAYKPPAPEPEKTAKPPGREDLIDQLQRQRRESRATTTPERREQERQLNDQLRRAIDGSNIHQR